MTRARPAILLACGAVVLAIVVAVVVWRVAADDDEPGASATVHGVVRDVGAAADPFDRLTDGRVEVGGRTVRVVVADSEPERQQGLRGRSDAAPYDGMLFVFPSDTTTAFTMSGVPDALDIAFFAADGTRVDQLRMEPCAGTDATCPVYQSRHPFRYALETAAGAMPSGALRPG